MNEDFERELMDDYHKAKARYERKIKLKRKFIIAGLIIVPAVIVLTIIYYAIMFHLIT